MSKKNSSTPSHAIPLEEMNLDELKAHYRFLVDEEEARLVLTETTELDRAYAALGQMPQQQLTTKRTFAQAVIGWKGRMYDRIEQTTTEEELLRLRFDEFIRPNE